ncbi:MAG: hypothetical protein WC472_04725 [Candidatus Paceibacterota bacterium]
MKATKIVTEIEKLNKLGILKKEIVIKKGKDEDVAYLADTYIAAVNTLSDDEIPEDVAKFYNELGDEIDAQTLVEKEEVVEEKVVEKKPAKAEKKKEVVKEKPVKNKVSGRSVVAEIVKEGKYTEEKVIANAVKKGIPDKIAKMYIKAWRKDDRVPDGKKLHENKEKILSFK